ERRLLEQFTGIRHYRNIFPFVQLLIGKKVINISTADGTRYRFERNTAIWKGVHQRNSRAAMRQAILVAEHLSGQGLMHPLLEDEVKLALRAVQLECDLTLSK